MLDKVKTALLYFMNTIQAGKLYSEDHPKFEDFASRLFTILGEILDTRKELIFGIVDHEVAWEDEIFFDMSHKLRGLINFLEESGIQRVVLQQGLREDELRSFLAFLTRTKRQEQIDEDEYFTLHGIQNIRAGRLKSQVQVESSEKRAEETVKQYQSSLQMVTNSMNQALNEEEIDYLDLRFNILNVMENFMGRHQELLNLVSVKKRDLITFMHLLNVSLLSMFVASLIVSMCDVYDALAQKRTYKKDYPPDKIYELMVQERGKLFDPQLLDRFFHFIGVWPMGILVKLNDKSVAVVRETNEQDIFNPRVEVLSPRKKRGHIDLREAGDLRITRALNPLGDGKKYLEMI